MFFDDVGTGEHLVQCCVHLGLVLNFEVHLHRFKEIRGNLVGIHPLLVEQLNDEVFLFGAGAQLLNLVQAATDSKVDVSSLQLLPVDILHNLALPLCVLLLKLVPHLLLLFNEGIVDVYVEQIPQKQGIFARTGAGWLEDLLVALEHWLEPLNDALSSSLFQGHHESIVLQFLVLLRLDNLLFQLVLEGVWNMGP